MGIAFGARRLALDRYRNYRSLEIDLAPGFNVVSGANAQGKTNLLEALYLLASTRVLRGQRDAEAVLDGEERARVAAELLSSHTEIAIVLEKGIRKRAFLNSLSLPRASDLIGRMPAIAFTAEDLSIVRGEPTDRRLALDLDLSALYPAYLRHLTAYKRALEQRNALLRDSREEMAPATSFEPWEAHMAHHGAALRDSRREYVAEMAPLVRETHGELASGEVLELGYVARDEATGEEELLEALVRSRPVDVHRGGSGVGPHRDDLAIEVGGRDARLFGSQGQQRTATISLKLGALAVAQRELGMPPLLLLDDIFSDLDSRRRGLLVERICASAGQVVLTCTEPSAAGESLLKSAKVFKVQAGEVYEA